MVPRALVVPVTLLLVPILAGCLGDDPTPTDGGAPRNAEQARVTDRTGSVTGQVITIDLEVVVDASVRLLNATGAPSTTQTDVQGRYTFNDIPSGHYRLEVAATCCPITVHNADVVAGTVTELNLRLERLTPSALHAPFVVSDRWEGFLACGLSVASQPNDACATGDGNHDPEHLFDIGSGIQELVVAVTWRATAQSLAEDLRVTVENRNCSGCFQRYAYLNGPPPLVAYINDDHIERDTGHFVNITAFMDMAFSVTAGGHNVVYQQPFTIHWHEFYNHRAPEGFQALPDA